MSRRAVLLRAQLVEAARRPARTLLTGLAVIVAAFVVFGTVLAYQVTERTVLAGFSGTPAAADLVVTGGDGVSLRTLDAARRLPGVAEAVGRTDAFHEFADDRGAGLSVYADPGAGPLATARVVQGRYPATAGELAVTRRTVDRLGLAVGGTVRLAGVAPDRPVGLTVVGVVDAPDDSGEAAYTTDAFAARLGGSDQLRQVEVRLAPGADPDAVSAALTRAASASGASAPGASAGPSDRAGDGVVVRTGAEARRAEADEVSGRVQDLFALVTMFVAIAVVAAVLVATSTFRIVFAQRMRQLALLRAVGAPRAGLFGALVVEGAGTGIVAGLAGVLAAYGVGHGLPPVLRAFGLAVASPGHPIAAAVAVALGAALVTALAVLAPAVTAARVAPLEALRTASTTAGRRGIGWARAGAGVLLAAGAVLAALLVASRLPGPDTENYDPVGPLLAIVASGALAYAALVALGPLLVRPVLAVVGWPLRRLGPLGRLAVGGVGGAPRRASAVSVVVALGVTLVAGALVGSASLGALLKRELAGMAPADVAVTARGDGPLPAGLVQRVRGIGELDRVVPYRSSPDVRVAGAEVDGLTATDLDLRALATWADFGASAGRLTDAGPGRVVLLRFLAEEAGARPGDEVTVTRGDRSVRLRVAATMANTPVGAGLLVDPADLDRLGVPAGPTGLLADVAGDDEQARTAAVRALRAAGGQQVGIVVTADDRDELDGQLGALLGVLLGVLGLTVVVAVVGVGTTTALSVVERTRESGLLRAVGMSRRRLGAMLTVEAGLYGVLGAALGLLLALPYSWLTVAALGQDAPVEFPAGQLAGVVLALAVATALAGLLPARRAARVSPVAALGAGD
ncbi:ABC transporter permease [Micromonospora carbonacea]|uniref:FtsX-like permease family protein n=1 Tax=Micromonospora carbonacea TaxID=47853 RepID=A0A7H8XSS0_9ACTN|nr:ABC transporter permease [Micromonospora carbonacea]MBB5824955.1 putative ABC transport system permease protein [Micromonospora carbonacea]QLD26922.1 FtsX-like permease family protein [Micromonospora carbonacea]